MNLAEIIYKIKTYYNDYLIDVDRLILDGNPQESDIRKIVNKIWEEYLTTPFNFSGKNEFCYLVKKNDLLFFMPDKFEDYPVFQDDKHYLEILSNENILEECGGRVGFTVKIDWLKADVLLLPIDIIKGGKNVKAKLLPIAIFCINIGEGIVDANYESAQFIAEKNNLLFLDLNMRNYVSNYKIGLGDKERIINGFISYYLLDKREFSNLEEHIRLRKLYGSYIIKRYSALVKEDMYDDFSFIKEITEFIDTKENILSIKL